jgi:CRP/FNR family transcriptional regulator
LSAKEKKPKINKDPEKAQSTSGASEAEALLLKTMDKSPYLRDLPSEVIQGLASSALKKTHLAGELIFSRGDKVTGFYLVTMGKIKIFVSDPSGKERTIKIAESGEFFGEAALFQRAGYPAAASAIVKSQSFYFPKADMLRLIRENPDLAFATIGVLAERLSHFAALLEGSLKESSPRLAAYLLDLPEEDGKVRLPVKKVELARHLGLTAESLSRALSDLKARSLISEEKSAITLLRRDLLERHAEGLDS